MKNLAPRLRHRCTIQYPVEEVSSDSDSGSVTVIWTDFLVDEPVEMVPLSGRELIAANAQQHEAKVRATIRCQSGVTEKMRLVHLGKNYNIVAIQPDPTFRRWLTLMLSEGLTDGG
jgi:SPP1 family predicted phage head-tail adaptor